MFHIFVPATQSVCKIICRLVNYSLDSSGRVLFENVIIILYIDKVSLLQLVGFLLLQERAID